jgi:hypothetical protein
MYDYKTTLKTRAFLYLELKKASALYLQGILPCEIKRMSQEENIFLYKSKNRMKDVASTIIERIEVLDPYLLQKIVSGGLETSKLISLYAILKTDRLFFEFMQEVFREKQLLRDYIIADKDFRIFFQRKAEQSQQVAAWKDYTHYKLQQVYKRILMEAGLAKKCKTNIEIVKPMIELDVLEHIKGKGDHVYLQALLGES